MSNPDGSFVAFVCDQLRSLNGVSARRMFGGHGLYVGTVFFGIVHAGRLYFKTDDQTRAAYRAHGMEAFQPNTKQTLVSYYEVPLEVLDDAETLFEWAGRAVSVARRECGKVAPKSRAGGKRKTRAVKNRK